MCCVRLGCLLCYYGCSCLCCFSGAGFSDSTQLRSKQQHKDKESSLRDVHFLITVMKYPKQSNLQMDNIPIISICEIQTSLLDIIKVTDSK